MHCSVLLEHGGSSNLPQPLRELLSLDHSLPQFSRLRASLGRPLDSPVLLLLYGPPSRRRHRLWPVHLVTIQMSKPKSHPSKVR